MSFKIQHTDNITVEGIKTVIYGPPKIGKTRLSATAANPFIVSTEKGLLSLRAVKVPFVEIENTVELRNVYEFLLSNDAKAQAIGTITFDSISDLGEVVLGDKKRGTKDNRRAYGETNDIVMQIFRDFRNLNKNVYFIAKEQWYSGQGGANCVRPSMPDAYLTQQLPYMFDVVGRMQTFIHSDGREYVGVRTKPDFLTVAGDRSGSLDEWEPPDLAHIYQKILTKR